MQVSRKDLAWALSRFVESIPEFPEEIAETPFDQTVRLPDGRYLQMMFLEADQDIFDRR